MSVVINKLGLELKMKHKASDTMNVEKHEVLPMTGGCGVTSYAVNSSLQEEAITKSKLLVEEAIKEIYTETQTENLVVADMGCSSGPNTYLLLSIIINALADHCHGLGQKPPEIQCFLSDLPENDFNTLFRNLKFLETKIDQKKEDAASVPNYYVVGVPGNFYGRLFPSNSVHFFHSSYCLHWCSKVPDGVKHDEGLALNKKNIYIAKTSTSNIIESYYEQFKCDFSRFLDQRYNELVPGGRMVLSSLGRKSLDARFGELSCLLGLLADALNSMVQEGLVQKEKAESFKFPVYTPSVEEVEELIIKHGSFSIDQLYTMISKWDPKDECIDNHKSVNSLESGKNVAIHTRAACEPMLTRHFGPNIMDQLFAKFAVNVANHLLKEKGNFIIIVISLVSKKEC